MIGIGLVLLLLVFAIIGFAGAGASLAVARSRWFHECDRDVGMLGVALMLTIFGALCTVVAVGVGGIGAIGPVVIWASYVFMAQRLDLFRIEVQPGPNLESSATGPRSLT